MASRGGWRERQRGRELEYEPHGFNFEPSAQMTLISVAPKPEKKIKEPDFSAPSQMVIFIIGKDPNKQAFMVHKEHACQYSPVLDKAFNSTFKEGETQTYTIDDTTVGAFRMFVQWVYSQKLNVSVDHGDNWLALQHMRENQSPHICACIKETFSLLQLWVLSEKLMVPLLQDVVMDQFNIIRRTRAELFDLHLNYIYANTSKESPLRRFVVQVIAWSPGIDYKEIPWQYPKEFLLDLATVYHTAVPARTQTKKMDSLDISEYYATKEE